MRFVRLTLTTAVLGIVFLLALAPQLVPSPTHDRPPAPGSPRDLIDRHACWTDEAPADMEGRFPGHVVVTRPDQRTVYSARLVGPSLEQVFDGADHDLRVHAFCR